jgi:hypothetical protein
MTIPEEDTELMERSNCVYAGTFVKNGHGKGRAGAGTVVYLLVLI